MRKSSEWYKKTISQNANKGFTFVELLIVVAIIAILASIAIPQFVEMRKAAVHATMLSDLKNCINKAEAWGGDNNGYTGFNVAECVVTHANNLIVASVSPNSYTITVSNPNAPAGKTTCTFVSGGQITCS